MAARYRERRMAFTMTGARIPVLVLGRGYFLLLETPPNSRFRRGDIARGVEGEEEFVTIKTLFMRIVSSQPERS